VAASVPKRRPVGQPRSISASVSDVAKSKGASPAAQLAAFMKPYAPAIQKTARTALAKLRAQIPGATEMVYDTYNALVIGFGPNDRASEAIVSIALYPKWVNLYFLDGAALPDPGKLLKGSGTRVRNLRLEDPAILDSPAVKTLIGAAVADADSPFPRRPRRLLIKAAVSRKRPRRPR
jgi:hypothetical protein